MQKGIIKLKRCPSIISSYSVVGQKEYQGPLGKGFDEHGDDDKFGKDSWEAAEAEMQRIALAGAIKKAQISDTEVDILLSGDLLNQCISSSFGLKVFNIPYLGQYGACSTMVQSLIMASIMVESGAASCAAAVTSSHFCSAERQYRFPLEYGGQRTPTAQWTATASGSCIVETGKNGITVSRATVGKIVDLGITDMNNMGAAMAPVNGKIRP